MQLSKHKRDLFCHFVRNEEIILALNSSSGLVSPGILKFEVRLSAEICDLLCAFLQGHGKKNVVICFLKHDMLNREDNASVWTIGLPPLSPQLEYRYRHLFRFDFKDGNVEIISFECCSSVSQVHGRQSPLPAASHMAAHSIDSTPPLLHR